MVVMLIDITIISQVVEIYIMVRLKYRYIIGQVLLDPNWEAGSGVDIVSTDLQNALRVSA